jgi:hypothetical protein
LPGARPANSRTRRPVRGGGDVILDIGDVLGYPIESIEEVCHGVGSDVHIKAGSDVGLKAMFFRNRGVRSLQNGRGGSLAFVAGIKSKEVSRFNEVQMKRWRLMFACMPARLGFLFYM